MKIEWSWKDFFTFRQLGVILLGILVFMYKEYILITGGLFFLFLGIILILRKKVFESVLGSTLSLIGLFSIIIFFCIKYQYNLNVFVFILIYCMLILSTILYVILFLRSKDKNNFEKIVTAIIFVILLVGLYKILIQQLPNLLQETNEKGLLNLNNYLFALFLPVIIVFMIAEISKRTRFILNGKENNYLDILIGAITFVLFCGYYLLRTIESNQLQYFLGIIASIFIIVSSISSLKHIIKN